MAGSAFLSVPFESISSPQGVLKPDVLRELSRLLIFSVDAVGKEHGISGGSACMTELQHIEAASSSAPKADLGEVAVRLFDLTSQQGAAESSPRAAVVASASGDGSNVGLRRDKPSALYEAQESCILQVRCPEPLRYKPDNRQRSSLPFLLLFSCI